MRDTQRQKQRHRQGEKQTPSQDHRVTPRAKSRRSNTEPPRRPVKFLDSS